MVNLDRGSFFQPANNRIRLCKDCTKDRRKQDLQGTSCRWRHQGLLIFAFTFDGRVTPAQDGFNKTVKKEEKKKLT